jgi:hypothetical protein
VKKQGSRMPFIRTQVGGGGGGGGGQLLPLWHSWPTAGSLLLWPRLLRDAARCSVA